MMEASSKKGDLAQAGRKKLEDFRKKKAEAAAAKAKALNGGSLKKHKAKSSPPVDAKQPVTDTADDVEAQGTGKGERESEGLGVESSALSVFNLEGQASLGKLVANGVSLKPLRSHQTGANSLLSNGVETQSGGAESTSRVSLESEAGSSNSQAKGASHSAGVEGRRDKNEGSRTQAEEIIAEPKALAGRPPPVTSKPSTGEPSLNSAAEVRKRASQTQAAEQPSRGTSGVGGADANSLSAATRVSSLNGAVERGEPSGMGGPSVSAALRDSRLERGESSSAAAVSSQPSTSSQDAPHKDHSSEVATTIAFLSPSLPTPSPSPHRSPSPSHGQPATVYSGIALRAPSLATPSLIQTAPPGVSLSQAAPSISQVNELHSRLAVPASLSGPFPRATLFGVENQDLRSDQVQGTNEYSAPPVVGSNDRREGQESSAATSFLTAADTFPASRDAPLASSPSPPTFSGLSSLSGRVPSQGELEVQESAGTSGRVDSRPGETSEGSASARLPAARAMLGVDTARRRLDFALAQQSESNTDALLGDPAFSTVPRVQSQPSFKDYVLDDSEAEPYQPRSQTPDPVSPVVLDPRSLAQTATSLRSSLANLFAPTATFPRPQLDSGRETQTEEMQARTEIRMTDGSVQNGSQSLQNAGESSKFVPPRESRPAPPQADPPASTSQATAIASITPTSRSPSVAITTNPAEASKPPPAKVTEAPSAKSLSSVKLSRTKDKPKPDITNSQQNASNGLPNSNASWLRARPQSPPIDLNPSAPQPPAFIFPSSNGERDAHPPAQRASQEPPSNEGVIVSPRRDQARSPRRRPKSPVPETRSPPGMTASVQPRGARPAQDDRRRSSNRSSGSVEDEKLSYGSAKAPSNGAPHEEAASDGPQSSLSKGQASSEKKAPAKRSLLFSALAPTNQKPPVRSSFLSSPEESNGAVKEVEAETPSRRSSFAPISSSSQSPNGRERNNRLLRLPSMPAVSEASPSPGDRTDGSDFASIEQHIEDLTQEKFALQRGAEAARALAASLEEENSRLTEDFNRQAQAVQTLKAEVERQQAEIQAQQLVAEAMSEDRERLQRENAGALEQAQMMGREVVHLEEAVLKLRSSELKLRKELEATQSGHEAARRQLTTLAADRASLRQMMDAMQEERRLLVAKLRMLGAKDALDEIRSQIQAGNALLEKVDATTSTDDLPSRTELPPATQTAHSQVIDSQVGPSNVSRGTETLSGQSRGAPNLQIQTADTRLQVENDAQTSIRSGEARTLERPQVFSPSTSSAERVAAAVAAAVLSVQNSPSTSRLGRSASLGVNGDIVVPVGISDDQARVIENVNRLLDEIAAERRAMATALEAETEACEELRISNSELSRKVAILSEQLRLTKSAQQEDGPSLVNGSAVETMRVDEGDEVVERVLGWISNFFAGKRGPA